MEYEHTNWTFSFCVRSSNDGLVLFCLLVELPPAPSNVTKVSAIGQRNVTLQWTKPTDVSANQMIEYFVIKYQLLGNTEEHEAAIVSSKFSVFEVTNLLPGTTHIVWVVSRNAAGDSPGSNTLNVTTKPSGECHLVDSDLVVDCSCSSVCPTLQPSAEYTARL